jgi:hypothetical protein
MGVDQCELMLAFPLDIKKINISRQPHARFLTKEVIILAAQSIKLRICRSEAPNPIFSLDHLPGRSQSSWNGC